MDHPLLGVRKDGPNQVVFLFANDEKLRTDVNDYFGLRGSVQPLRFATAFRGLKNILHQTLRAQVPVETQVATPNASNVEAVPGTPTVRRRRATS